MSKVLVLGDYIEDFYEFYTATRLCPEGPAPVLIQIEGATLKSGGAALVADQLNALEKDSAKLVTGSVSHKTRIFADDRLMLRIDDDSFDVKSAQSYRCDIATHLEADKFDAVIASDYGKGAFTKETAEFLVRLTDNKNIPLFVDAKTNFEWYAGAFAAFPNEKEFSPKTKHVIQKLGVNGCAVDGIYVPTTPHAVRDVTGAGDVFLAAFVYQWLTASVMAEHPRLQVSAEFANKVAGISVEYVGTHVVTKDELDKI